jgi:hypothetical protein
VCDKWLAVGSGRWYGAIAALEARRIITSTLDHATCRSTSCAEVAYSPFVSMLGPGMNMAERFDYAREERAVTALLTLWNVCVYLLYHLIAVFHPHQVLRGALNL